MEPEPTDTTGRLRRVLVGVTLVGVFTAGCFIGGFAAAAARDSVASSKLSAAQGALEACQAREVIEGRVIAYLQDAFEDLASDDPVDALTNRTVASEYLDHLSGLPECTFAD